MRHYALPFIILLSACGSGSDGSQNTSVNVPAQQNQSYTYSGPPIQPAASTGFAKQSDDISNITSGTMFATEGYRMDFNNGDLTARTHETQNISGTFKSPTEIDLVLEGRVYPLTYDASLDEFVTTEIDSSATKTVSLFFSQEGQYSAFVSTSDFNDYGSFGSGHILISAMGYSTDPNQLPARASYSGDAFVTAIPEAGGTDTAFGTVNFDADFANSSVTGVMSLQDPIGDTAGPVDFQDIDLTFTRSFLDSPGFYGSNSNGGKITGNTFSTELKADSNQWFTAGFTSTPSINMTGSFFGPSGEEAVGVGIGNGWAYGGFNSSQVILLSTFSATKN